VIRHEYHSYGQPQTFTIPKMMDGSIDLKFLEDSKIWQYETFLPIHPKDRDITERRIRAFGHHVASDDRRRLTWI
jgi:hypothetical protein